MACHWTAVHRSLMSDLIHIIFLLELQLTALYRSCILQTRHTYCVSEQLIGRHGLVIECKFLVLQPGCYLTFWILLNLLVIGASWYQRWKNGFCLARVNCKRNQINDQHQRCWVEDALATTYCVLPLGRMVHFWSYLLHKWQLPTTIHRLHGSATGIL